MIIILKDLWEILLVKAKKVLLNIILIKEDLICLHFQHISEYKTSFVNRTRQLVALLCFESRMTCLGTYWRYSSVDYDLVGQAV